MTLTVFEPVISVIFSGPAYFGANFADIPYAAEEITISFHYEVAYPVIYLSPTCVVI